VRAPLALSRSRDVEAAPLPRRSRLAYVGPRGLGIEMQNGMIGDRSRCPEPSPS
jgi:hypothetical protein